MDDLGVPLFQETPILAIGRLLGIFGAVSGWLDKVGLNIHCAKDQRACEGTSVVDCLTSELSVEKVFSQSLHIS